MGQVPEYAIIGDGRLATHFAYYFDLLGISYEQWSRRLDASESCPPFSDVIKAQRIVLLLKDAAIEPFIKQHPELQQRCLIHCSGSLVTPLAHSAHPLQSFSNRRYDLANYQNIPFIIEAEGPSFTELFPHLLNPYYSLARDQKPLYHSLCVASGNFTTLLWQEVFKLFQQELKLPAEVLIPYLQQNSRNLVSDRDNALTGPFSRNDLTTINNNIAALANHDLQNIYRAFAQTFLKQYEVEA